MSAVKDFKCSNCGASLPIPQNSKGHVKCPSCKTECVIEGLVKNAEMADKENINSGFPLRASPATLHRNLVSFLSESPNMPIDVFEQVEVIREEHHCVPAYLFYCNGTATFTYQAINIRQHKTTEDLGDKSVTTWENYEESTLMNSSANASANLFASGNKTFSQQIQKLYMFLDTSKLIDFDELDFPYDVVTYDYNFPQAASFNEYIKPYMDMLIEKEAKRSLAGKKTSQLSMGGSRIDKDEIVRVFLGLYRIVFKYGDKEYSVWSTGDGEKAFHEGMPEDENREKELAQKQQAKESIPKAKTEGLMFGMIMSLACGILAFLFKKDFGEIPVYGFMGLCAIAIVIIIMRLDKKDKVYGEQQRLAEDEINAFKAQAPDVVQQFKTQKKALRGIYEECTGDAAAF